MADYRLLPHQDSHARLAKPTLAPTWLSSYLVVCGRCTGLRGSLLRECFTGSSGKEGELNLGLVAHGKALRGL